MHYNVSGVHVPSPSLLGLTSFVYCGTGCDVSAVMVGGVHTVLTSPGYEVRFVYASRRPAERVAFWVLMCASEPLSTL